MKPKMKHLVRLESGYDCIKFECTNKSESCVPGSGGSHGRHGLTIRFVTKGPMGAVQFLLYTGWLPQYVKESGIGARYIRDWGGMQPLPADLGYHSKKPLHEGQQPTDKACMFCDGLPCYYDGSGLNASDAMYALVNRGGKALWDFLDAYYRTVFEGAEYPVPAEYKMPRRKVKKT